MTVLRLKELREGRKLNQADIAKHLQIARTTYARYETGEREMAYDALIKLGELFDVSVDYLLGRYDANPMILSKDEESLINMFRIVDDRGHQAILSLVIHEYSQASKSLKKKVM